jgi:phosphodiesterase/alkaline phosphatase D-like protein
VNGSCEFINRIPGISVLLQAYLDFQPVRKRRATASADCGSGGTWQLYFAQRCGAHTIFINVDDRSYRDIKLKLMGGAGDTGHRADNQAQTMLGATQLVWLEKTLLDGLPALRRVQSREIRFAFHALVSRAPPQKPTAWPSVRFSEAAK